MDELQKSFATTLREPSMMGENRFQEQRINDLPILRTQDGTIVCIKKRDEVSAIGIVGSSGTGKSVLLQNLSEKLFYSWNDDVILMNDYQSETLFWSEPSDIKDFISLASIIGMKPIPLPLVYVYPNTSDLVIDSDDLKYKNYIKVSLPLSEVLSNLPFYFNAICPEFELGQSTMYAQDMIEDFANCEVLEDFYDVIDEKIDTEKYKGFRAMKIKLKTAFRAVFNEGILRNTAPDAPCYLELGNFKSDPISVLRYANVIPSLIVDGLRSKKYQNAIIAYHIRSIFDSQALNEFRGKNVYLVFDELSTICSTENKESNPAKKAIVDIVARGRIRNMGIIYATQWYNKIPPEIKSAKLNYLICFKTSREIARHIASDFVLEKETISSLQKLGILEAVAMTNDKFVCYKDEKVWETNEPMRGKVIPPSSNHKWVTK